MKPRFRFLAALFALSALILFQVEGLWASSACSQEMEMEMSVASQTVDADSQPPLCPPGESRHSHEQDGKDPQAPDCPLMPAGAASCVGGVAVLPSSDEPALGRAGDEPSLSSSDHAKDLLLAVSLLRPPQA